MSNDLALMLIDAETAKAVQLYQGRAVELVARVEALGPVASEHDAHDRNRLAVEAQSSGRELETLRKIALAPIDEQRKTIQALFASIAEPLDRVKRTLQLQLVAWQEAENAKLRAAQEAARKVREEAERVEREARAAILAAAEASVDAAVDDANAARDERIKAEFVEAYVPPERHGLKAREGGSTSFRRVWTFEVCVSCEVPREYCEPSDKLIRAAVTAGAREIRGVRIYERVQSTTRG